MNAHAEIVKALPSAFDAEQGVLGALLLRNDAMAAVSGFLSAEHFEEPAHRVIFEAIAARVRDGRPASPITVAADLPEFRDRDITAPAYLAHLAASAWTVGEDILGVAREIVRAATLRRLIGISADISDHVQVPGTDPKAIISATEMVLIGLSEELERLEPVSRNGTPDAVLEEAHRRMTAGEHWRGARCGLTAIDDMLGGFAPGEFILVGGRPSMGKTALALTMARRAAHLGFGVGFDSIEMPASSVWHRLISDECEAAQKRIAYQNIAKGRISTQEFEIANRAKDRLKQLPLRINDRGDRLSDLPAHIRNARRWLQQKRGKDLNLFFIDYLGLLKPGDRYAGQRVNEVGEISATVKSLAKREGVAIVGLHQMSRANEGRDDHRPRLSDLRDSGSLEQDADVVMFVYREEYYLSRPGYRKYASDDEKVEALVEAEHKMEAIIAKHRNGATGTAKLWCDMATNSVRDQAR